MNGETLVNMIAGFAAGAVDPSPDARRVLEMSLADWAAVGIAGRETEAAQIMRAMVEAEGGSPQSSVIGGARLPARAAALANGTISHALDYDDTHFAHIGHPSVAVLPAALAAAELTGAGAGVFRTAALVGAETSIRIGMWLGRGHYQTGFHQTATAGTFGAAVSAARLLGCDHGQMRHAMGLAATRASGLKSQFGTMGKPYNAGLAAAGGLEAALLARAGFTSASAALDGPQGFGPTHHGADDRTAFEGLGRDWVFTGVSHKFHACCHGLHAMLEALGGLCERIAAREIAHVAVATHPRWHTVCNIMAPETGLEAKFSYRLTAAMVLTGRDTAGLDSYDDDACRDPALVALRDRIEVRLDEGVAETAADVQVTLADGSCLQASHDLETPMPIEARQLRLEAKLRALLGTETAARLQAAVLADDISGLSALLRA